MIFYCVVLIKTPENYVPESLHESFDPLLLAAAQENNPLPSRPTKVSERLPSRQKREPIKSALQIYK